MAVAAIATLVPVPVKFTADRLEGFVSDAHTREANVRGRMALSADGKIFGIEIDMLAGFGAYSIYPRGSVGEVIQTLQMIGAPYEIGAYRGRVRGVFQNKPPTGDFGASASRSHARSRNNWSISAPPRCTSIRPNCAVATTGGPAPRLARRSTASSSQICRLMPAWKQCCGA